jgi:uncharacterized membrane protein
MLDGLVLNCRYVGFLRNVIRNPTNAPVRIPIQWLEVDTSELHFSIFSHNTNCNSLLSPHKSSMTDAFAVTAFVKAKAFRGVAKEMSSKILFSPSFTSSILTSTTATTTTALLSTVGTTRILESCISYFDSTKIISTLNAGFSLAALFSFTRDVQETFHYSKSRVYLLRLYHVVSLLSFCFSFATILMAQVGSTALLLNTHHAAVTTCVDAFSFLTANMHDEFLIMR